MQAVIPAVGYGNRMHPLTDRTCGCLREIGGQTVIDRILDGLAANGVDRALAVTGCRADDLRRHLESTRPDPPIWFVHNPRDRQANNVFSRALA